MKAELYRESPVLGAYLDARGEAGKYPVCRYSPAHRMVPAGYVIDTPDAYLLVRQGTARPADEECRLKANVSPEDMVKKYERQKLLEAGKLTGDPKYDAPDEDS